MNISLQNKPAISPSHQTIRQYYSSFAHDPVLQSSVESKEEPVTKGAGDTEGEGDKADDTVTNGENNEESTSKQRLVEGSLLSSLVVLIPDV